LSEQRHVLYYYCLLRKTRSQALGMLRLAYGDRTLSRATCYRWYEAFELGRKFTALWDGPGALLTVLTQRIINIDATIVCEEPRITVRQLAYILDVSVGSANYFDSSLYLEKTASDDKRKLEGLFR